jgi:tripartite-type tricarboxylate transporter receptor subunit TctC
VALRLWRKPNRPLTVLVPFPAGGPSDAIVRAVTDSISRALAQPIVVQSVTGGGGTVAALRVKRAPPDGYTIMTGQLGTHAAASALQPGLGYDPRTDFTPVGLMALTPVVILGRRDFPPNDLQKFVAYLKANAHELDEGHAGPGSISFASCMLFNQILKVRPRLVPHDGAVAALQALEAGQVDYMCDQLVSAVPAARAKRVKAYAVAAAERDAALPDLPTTREDGLPEYEVSVWTGLFGPAGVPSGVIERLNTALSNAFNDKSVRDRLLALGAWIPESEQRSPQHLAELVRNKVIRWAAVGRQAGFEAKQSR